MAVKKGKTRIILTITEKMDQWLEKSAKKLNLSKSQLVRYLLKKNIQMIANSMTVEDFETLKKIAKVPWIYNEEDY